MIPKKKKKKDRNKKGEKGTYKQTKNCKPDFEEKSTCRGPVLFLWERGPLGLLSVRPALVKLPLQAIVGWSFI